MGLLHALWLSPGLASLMVTDMAEDKTVIQSQPLCSAESSGPHAVRHLEGLHTAKSSYIEGLLGPDAGSRPNWHDRNGTCMRESSLVRTKNSCGLSLDNKVPHFEPSGVLAYR
jgi:hypothetical protein